MAENNSKNFIDTFEDFFKKAPALPANWKEAIVNITPWIALIFGILGILTALSGLGLLTFLAPLVILGGAREVASYGGIQISMIAYLASSILLLMAYPGTKSKKISGWNLLFWSEAVYIVGSFFSGSFVGAILGGLIVFYFLFQIKSYYK